MPRPILQHKQYVLWGALACLCLSAGFLFFWQPQKAAQTGEKAASAAASTSDPNQSTKEAENFNSWLVLAIIGAPILMILRRLTKGTGAGKTVSGLGSQIKGLLGAEWWKKGGWLKALGGYLLILLGIWQLLPSFWHWLTVEQGTFFALWLLVGLAATIAIISAKQKFAWALTLIWLAVALSAARWSALPSIRYWDLSPEEAEAKQKTEEAKSPATTRQANTTSSRVVGTEKVIAPVEEWSRLVTLPRHCQFLIDADGSVRGRDMSGNEFDIAPGTGITTDLGDNLSLRQSSFRFQSLTNQPTEVRIAWQFEQR